MTQTGKHEPRLSYQTLRKLLEKDKKLELHAITLSDCWRKEMIPRGLRISKFPSFGKDSPEFKQKWEAILNKCSLDLMLLLIEEAKMQRAELRQQIEETKQTLAPAPLDLREQSETTERKIQEDIDKLSKTLAQSKLEKLRRDQQDYENGTVHSWSRTTSQYPQRKRQTRSVSFSLPSSTTASEDEENVSGTASFLDNGAGPGLTRATHPRRKGKQGGVGRGENPQLDYHLRPQGWKGMHRTQTPKRR